MRHAMCRFAVWVVCCAVAGGAAAALADEGPDDQGYFLTLRQKGQLIGKGRVDDGEGGWYNIWICPGYADPLRNAGEGLRDTGTALAKYGKKTHYARLADHSGDAFEWAFDDCLVDFAVTGTPKAWKRYFARANERAEQRVFGWWLAHPWALLQSGVDTVVRVPLGVAGAAVGAAWGGMVVPAWYAVEPVGEAAWHTGVDVVLLPAAACTWNTLAAPLLALAGQQPAPDRVDGFWVRRVTQQQLMERAERNRPLTAAEETAADQLAASASRVYQPFAERFSATHVDYRQREQALREERDAAVAGLERELAGELRAASAVPPVRWRRRLEEALRDRLVATYGVSHAEANRLIHLLKQTADMPTPVGDSLEYTDPARESIRVIEDMDQSSSPR